MHNKSRYGFAWTYAFSRIYARSVYLNLFLFQTQINFKSTKYLCNFNLEQNREERDDYIDVLYQNIKSGYESNFEKARKGTTSGYGVGYDYGSVIFFKFYLWIFYFQFWSNLKFHLNKYFVGNALFIACFFGKWKSHYKYKGFYCFFYGFLWKWISLTYGAIYYLQTKANIGQREGFSDKDVQKLNNMYKCKRKNAKENETNSNIIMSLIGMGQNNA